ncbi:MAG: RNA-guided endonuclease TnpB family protein [Kiritimatiellales bacterium]
MRKTFLYKIKMNRRTESSCNQWLETCRTLYNLALEQRISVYRQDRRNISAYTQMGQLPELKEEFPQFRQVGSQCLQDVIGRLDKAFSAFFKRAKEQNGKSGFPRFKGRGQYNSFTLKQSGWKLDGRHLTIAKIGRIKIFLSRQIQGDIKTVTVKRSSSGKWFVMFSCDNIPTVGIPLTGEEVGIDVGIKSFAVDSAGRKFENPKYFRQSEKLLCRRQRRLSRKKLGATRRLKAKNLVAKCHEKIANQRKDFLHKTANYYIHNYDIIYIERLKIQNMNQNRRLSKNIYDSSWGLFFDLLFYKAENAGRTVIKVPPYNTSQKCSACGEKVAKSLAVRVHRCCFCGLVLDRDHNAALNILVAGQAIRALTDRVLTSVA